MNAPLTLYRATVAVVGAPSIDEVHVFFTRRADRSSFGGDEQQRLARQLAAIWHVPAANVLICTYQDEAQLLDTAWGDADTGDMRLFECGNAFGAAVYLDPAQCLMLVPPPVMRRLYAAADTLPIVVLGTDFAAAGVPDRTVVSTHCFDGQQPLMLSAIAEALPEPHPGWQELLDSIDAESASAVLGGLPDDQADDDYAADRLS